jgi:hypothetical protein
MAASPQTTPRGPTRQRYRYDLVESTTNYGQLLIGLFEAPPKRFQGQDIAFLNLLCAQTIKGAENLDIKGCIARLDRLTAQVKSTIKRNLYKYPNDPDYGKCEPMWKMAMLVTVVKRSYGAAYNPEIIARKQSEHVPMNNARDVFINGLLDENPHRRHGTCASIPVLIIAIARRLGYPVGLAVAGRHIIARWDGEGLCFNIEASNRLGMVIQSDDEYRRELIAKGNRPDAVRNAYFLRTLTPLEEFALFMTLRAECLIYAMRSAEALHVSARALQYAPADPIFTSWAIQSASMLIRQRTKQFDLRDAELPEGVFAQKVQEYLKPHERANFLTIWAHRREVAKQIKLAQDAYEEACRECPNGWHEQHDLQCFFQRHNVPRRPSGIPKDSFARLRFQLNCTTPHEAIQTLLNFAHDFESNGDLIRARDALQDLYLLEPCNYRVFVKAREIENHPDFQRQWDAFLATFPKRKQSLPT